MLRRNGVEWLVISADGAPWGATINTLHITHVRVQPQMIPPDVEGGAPEPTGLFEVLVSSVDGAQSLTYKKQEDALAEYFRLSNELRGSVVDDTKTG